MKIIVTAGLLIPAVLLASGCATTPMVAEDTATPSLENGAFLQFATDTGCLVNTPAKLTNPSSEYYKSAKYSWEGNCTPGKGITGKGRLKLTQDGKFFSSPICVAFTGEMINGYWTNNPNPNFAVYYNTSCSGLTIASGDAGKPSAFAAARPLPLPAPSLLVPPVSEPETTATLAALSKHVPAPEINPPSGPAIAPLSGSSGAYMSPYTEDNTVAPWVAKALNAKAGANIGGAIGSYAAQDAIQRAAGYIPFASMFAGQLGKTVGDKAGRGIAIAASGGWEFIRQNTDISFASISDMAIYLLQNNRQHGEFDAAMSATAAIYPELKPEMLRHGYTVK